MEKERAFVGEKANLRMPLFKIFDVTASFSADVDLHFAGEVLLDRKYAAPCPAARLAPRAEEIRRQNWVLAV